MKKFLNRLIIWISPILILLAMAEYMLRQIPNDYQLKAHFYKVHASDIETLILGNSHGYYDLNPVYFKKMTFNGAHVAQSLDLDAEILFKYKNQLTKLRYLIIPISDMSFFFRLMDLSDWRQKNYTIYYHIGSSWNPIENSELLSLPFSINRHRLIAYYLQHEYALTSSEWGYGTNFKSEQTTDLNATAPKEIGLHRLGGWRNFDLEKGALEKIVSFCRDRQIKVILFIPPAFSSYSSQIDSTRLRTTLNTCYGLTHQYNNVHFFNLLNDSLFTENDYFDVDHLNDVGAKKLSLKMDSILNHLANHYHG